MSSYLFHLTSYLFLPLLSVFRSVHRQSILGDGQGVGIASAGFPVDSDVGADVSSHFITPFRPCGIDGEGLCAVVVGNDDVWCVVVSSDSRAGSRKDEVFWMAQIRPH